jgi:endonuclease/exonuclease/phosphatase family metal-dependent hydrolase
MRSRTVSRSIPFIALTLSLIPLACQDSDLPTAAVFSEGLPTTESPILVNGEPLKVLTRNMYMGGDVGLVFAADFSDMASVVAAATQVWGQVQASNFAERAQALAREIRETRPHFVGIQEIPQFIVLNQSYAPIDVQDHLQMLMEALDGLPYSVAAVQEATVAVMPVMLPSGLHFVQFTDRIAALVRDDLDVTDVSQGVYQAHYQMNPDLDLRRGWIRVAADVSGVPYHFVSTHLEGQSLAPVQAGQAQELIQSVTANLDGVTVLMGDLNSDAEGGPGVPSWTPTYQTLLAAGFQDTWEVSHPQPTYIGFTCCQDKDLLNPVSDLEERIDFVLLKPGDHQGNQERLPGSIHVEVVGGKTGEQTAVSGLWPSDHAGLLAQLKIPVGIFNR